MNISTIFKTFLFSCAAVLVGYVALTLYFQHYNYLGQHLVKDVLLNRTLIYAESEKSAKIKSAEITLGGSSFNQRHIVGENRYEGDAKFNFLVRAEGGDVFRLTMNLSIVNNKWIINQISVYKVSDDSIFNQERLTSTISNVRLKPEFSGYPAH